MWLIFYYCKKNIVLTETFLEGNLKLKKKKTFISSISFYKKKKVILLRANIML